MPPTSDQLRQYLGPEESLTTVYTATRSDDGAPQSVAIGVTDRRLLCLSEKGRFLNVGHDAICAVRSRPRTRVDYRGNDYRLLVGGGGLLAVVGFAVAAVLASTLLASLLALWTGGALAVTAYLWTDGDAVDDDALSPLADLADRAFDGDDARRRYDRHVPDDVDDGQILLGASAVTALVGGIALVALTANLIVALTPLAVGGGAVLAYYGQRHRDDFDGIEIVRHREQEVRISTDDGRELHVLSDPAAAIDRDLSRQVFTADVEPSPPVARRS